MAKQLIRFFLGLVIVVMVVGLPWAYYVQRSNETRRFRVVEHGVLYRSGQLPLSSLRQIVREHGIKTIISFRMSRDDDPHPDDDEAILCRDLGMRFERIAYRGTWTGEQGENSPEERVRRFCEIMNDPRNHPVLVHCFAGRHRTGAYCAVYRMEFNGWSNRQAIEEMKELGYENIEDHPDLYEFLLRYEPRHAKRQ